MAKQKQKVIVAMSGGVDSSVSAYLLKKKGYEVEGLFMKLGHEQDEVERAVREVAEKLGVKLNIVDLSKAFKKEVIDYFLKSYQSGLTPNPCVKCNNYIKFGELFFYTREKLKGDYLATGHYVRKLDSREFKVPSGGDLGVGNMRDIKKSLGNSNGYKLYRGKDKGKDQSYFLYTLKQDTLRHVLFPVGNFVKDEVRKIADEAGVPYIKKESQDICFLYCDGRAVQHNEFLRANLKLKPGPIILLSRRDEALPRLKRGKTVNEEQDEALPRLYRGIKIGEHQGLPLYTIGQRREIRIGGTGPYYAARLDYKKNILYVVKDYDDPILYGQELTATEVNWVSGKSPELPFSCEAVIRYRHPAVKCLITKKVKNNYQVEFKKPQRAITPGQSIVFYKGNEVLGGGIIF